MEIQFTIGVSDRIQGDNSNDIQYTEELITMNQLINFERERRSFAQFLNPEGRYNIVCFDFRIDYITPRTLKDIMSWFYLQPTAVLYSTHACGYLLYYVENGFTREEFLKVYALLMYVVYSHEDLDVLLDQNDLSFLLNDIQYIGNTLPVIKTEYNPKNTISINKLNQLYKQESGYNNYNDLYDRIVLPYFKRRFDKLLFNCSNATPTPTTSMDNEFFNEFKTYYFQCNENDRTIRKLAKYFHLTRYRSEQYIKQCLS